MSAPNDKEELIRRLRFLERFASEDMADRRGVTAIAVRAWEAHYRPRGSSGDARADASIRKVREHVDLAIQGITPSSHFVYLRSETLLELTRDALRALGAEDPKHGES